MMKGLVLLTAVIASILTTQLRPTGPNGPATVSSVDALRRVAEENPDDPIAQYNLGTALVLERRYDEGRPYLERAARLLEPSERNAVDYNLGATDLEPAYLDEELAERDVRLRRAIEAYKIALAADPSDEDAKWNLELARRLLEQDPESSSGGGGGGAGGQGQPMPGTGAPSPTPAGGDGPEPEMSETEAENLLQSARDQESAVQRDRLRKPQPPGPIRP